MLPRADVALAALLAALSPAQGAAFRSRPASSVRPTPALPRLFSPARVSFDGARLSRVPAAAILIVVPAQPPSTPEAAETGGQELFDAVRRLADHGFKARDYDAARRYMFSAADSDIEDGVRGVRESYSQLFVPGASDDGNDYPERGDQNQDGWVDVEGMNAEHLWPQSFFGQREPMRSDLYHLLPTFIHLNELRGHLPFGEVEGTPDYSNPAGAKRGQGLFEPPRAIKGRVARAMLYFFLRYHDRGIRGRGFSAKFWNQRVELFLRWNRESPPDDDERRRNDLVEDFQGNRNPFVDDPTLADRIGAEPFRFPPPKRLTRRGS